MDARIVWLCAEYGPWALALALTAGALVFVWWLAGMRARWKE